MNRPGIRLAALALLAAGTASAASHQWRFNEIYSNADGTIQFIEMHECCGFTAEHELNNKWILAVNSDHQYTFRKSLTGNTADRYFLLATAGFAALPGAPPPDFIIPDGFLPLDGDTLEYWMYDNAAWSYTVGQLPVDGVTSLNADHTTGVNSPTNYAGQSGSVVAAEAFTWGALKVRIW